MCRECDAAANCNSSLRLKVSASQLQFTHTLRLANKTAPIGKKIQPTRIFRRQNKNLAKFGLFLSTLNLPLTYLNHARANFLKES